MKKLRIGGKVSIFYTIGEFAELLGTTAQNIKVMEKRGNIPQANFRYGGNRFHREGNRVYSRELTTALVPLFAQIKQGVKMSDELKLKIAQQFQLEKQNFTDVET